jgi:hypothetical protein
VTFERLYRAGLTSLEELFLATAVEMASVTGVPTWLCERICAKVQEHRGRIEATSIESALSDRRAQLAELVAELRRQHEVFDRVARQDTAIPEVAARKRESRRERHACALRINVVLAEMGEISLVDEIKTLGFGRRIERLERYLRASPRIEPVVPGALNIAVAEAGPRVEG